MHILLVDDAEDIREVYRDLLGMVGHEVTVAESGERALVLAAERLPDLVLTDIMMAGMSGLELVIRLRSDFARPPRIVTVSGFPNMEAQALQCGADVFLAKPVDPADLIGCVARVLHGEVPDVEAARGHAAVRRCQITLEAERALDRMDHDPGQVDRLHFATRWLGALLECDCVAIFIEDGQPRIMASSAPGRYPIRGGSAALLRAALDVLQGGSSLLVGSATAGAAFGLDGLQLAAYPLNYHREPVGVVCLLREQGRAFDTMDLRVLEFVARIGSDQVSSTGRPRLLAKRHLLAAGPFEHLVGLLAECAGRDHPLLLALVQTRVAIDSSPDEPVMASPMATLAECGERHLGVLLSGRRAPEALEAELHEVLREIDQRWGSEAASASIFGTPFCGATGTTLLDGLRRRLDESPAESPAGAPQ